MDITEFLAKVTPAKRRRDAESLIPLMRDAPRKAATTIYLMDGVAAHADGLARLGPHTTGVGCVHIKDLEECDLDVLRAIVTRSYRTLTSGVFGNRAGDE